MTRFGKALVMLAVAPLFALAIATPARADLVLVTNRADIGATDSIDWGVLGPPFTVIPTNPFTIASVHGVNVTVSKPVGMFERRDENHAAGGWSGNFAPLDALLWTQPDGGPVTLNFGAVGIDAGGAQIQPDSFGRFIARIEAFDAMGNSLGSFTEEGNSTTTPQDVPADNSAIFIGVRSDQLNIHRLTFSLDLAPPDNPTPQDFAINRFDFNSNPRVASIPEPGGLALFSLTLLGLLGARRGKLGR
jgi:hypothetical protein